MTLIALLLGWLSVGGFFGAFVIPLDQLPPTFTFDGVFETAFRVCSFLYGAFALVSCIGLLKRSSWVRMSIWGWMASSIAFFGVIFVAVPPEFILGGYGGAGAFMLFVVGLFVMFDGFIRRRLTNAT